MSLIVCRFAADIYTLSGFTAASLFRFATNHLPQHQRTSCRFTATHSYKYAGALKVRTAALHLPNKFGSFPPCLDKKDSQIISTSTFKTVREAQDCVYLWYDNLTLILNVRNVEWEGECFKEPFGAYAWIEHEGIKEFCQSLVVTLP